MRTNRWDRHLAIFVLALFVLSCTTTKLPPVSSAGAAFEPLKDERRLWESASEEEGKLQENITPYQDPLLVDYLNDIVTRLNPPMMAANPELGYRVRVIEDPTLNAFAYPHGSLYLHTGLLARMENEDQLATVLAHEMSHVEGRHMLRHRRSARNKQIGFSIAAIAAAVVVAGEQGDSYRQGKYGQAARIGVLSDVMIGLGLQLAYLAAVNGYGRDLESEADSGAFDKLVAAGYNPEQAPLVFEALLAERGDSGKTEAFFFGSHPRLAMRIENATLWLAEHPDSSRSVQATGAQDPERFWRRMRTVVRDDARLNIEMGRLELADHELQRALDLMPGDPETRLLIGRLKLAQSETIKDEAHKAQLRNEAMNDFREALRLDPERPATHRELGLLAYRNEDFATACVQFRQYIELDPRAEDAQRIRDYLLELERDGHCP
jgi:predicted Zn-dependent protease